MVNYFSTLTIPSIMDEEETVFRGITPIFLQVVHPILVSLKYLYHLLALLIHHTCNPCGPMVYSRVSHLFQSRFAFLSIWKKIVRAFFDRWSIWLHKKKLGLFRDGLFFSSPSVNILFVSRFFSSHFGRSSLFNNFVYRWWCL